MVYILVSYMYSEFFLLCQMQNGKLFLLNKRLFLTHCQNPKIRISLRDIRKLFFKYAEYSSISLSKHPSKPGKARHIFLKVYYGLS